MDTYYVIHPFLYYWLPNVLTIAFVVVLTRIAFRRQKALTNASNQNSEELRQNTEAVKALTEEMRRKRDA